MRGIVLVTAALLGLACGPLGPLPGGSLSGNLASAPPADWAFSEAVEDVQLETRPSDPYSVNLWGAGIGAYFYVAAARGADAAWAQHIGADPRVRLRVGETLYELRAQRVDDLAERDSFLAALKRKYDFEPDPEDLDSAWLFKLGPR